MRLTHGVLFGVFMAGLLAGCGGGGDAGDHTSAAAGDVATRRLDLANGADRPLPTLVVQPTSAGRHPVVVFSHGYTRLPDDYLPLLKTWAGAGFIVVAPAFPHSARGDRQLDDNDIVNQPGDDAAVLSAVLALDTRDGDPLAGRIDKDHIAAAGHSLGGMTTVGMFTKHRDERLKAGVVLAGGQWPFGVGYTGTPAPILFVHGRADDVVKFAGSTEAYDPLPWPKALMELPAGDHLGPYIGAGAEFDAVAKATTDFLRWSLLGDQAARSRLVADAGGAGKVEDRLG